MRAKFPVIVVPVIFAVPPVIWSPPENALNVPAVTFERLFEMVELVITVEVVAPPWEMPPPDVLAVALNTVLPVIVEPVILTVDTTEITIPPPDAADVLLLIVLSTIVSVAGVVETEIPPPLVVVRLLVTNTRFKVTFTDALPSLIPAPFKPVVLPF